MPLPRITPVVLDRRTEPFEDPEQIFELKYDGFRAVAYIEPGSIRLVSRTGHEYKSLDTVRAGMIALPVTTAVLDGEIVHLDGEGRPQFNALIRRQPPFQFVAFDLLWINGRDLRCDPLVDRKRLLGELCRPPVLYADHIIGDGVALFREVCAHDLEGIVAKPAKSLYGPRAGWVKIKNPAYSQAVGRQDFFDLARRPAGRPGGSQERATAIGRS